MPKDQTTTLELSRAIPTQSPASITLPPPSNETAPHVITVVASPSCPEHPPILRPYISLNSTPISNPIRFSKIQDVVRNKFTKRFHKFSNLPIELRLQIWEAALPEPRIHELCLPNIVTPKTRRILRSNNGKPPAILHACQESRYLALRYLELMQHKPPPPAESEERIYAIMGFYFNSKLDTLYINHMADGMLGYSFYLDYFDDEVPKTMGLMKKWQNIALDSHWLSLMTFRVGHDPVQNRFQQMFPKVKDVTVVWDKRWLRMWHVRQLAWPGKTSLVAPTPKDLDALNWHWLFGSVSAEEGTRQYMKEEYGDEEKAPFVRVAKVKRERFMIRRDVRIAIRIASVRLGLKHLGPLRRI